MNEITLDQSRYLRNDNGAVCIRAGAAWAGGPRLGSLSHLHLYASARAPVCDATSSHQYSNRGYTHARGDRIGESIGLHTNAADRIRRLSLDRK